MNTNLDFKYIMADASEAVANAAKIFLTRKIWKVLR